jgi:uncharacterized membrane protein
MKEKIALFFISIGLIAVIIATIVIRFTNISMNETQLFVKYIPIWIVIIIYIIGGEYFINKISNYRGKHGN